MNQTKTGPPTTTLESHDIDANTRHRVLADERRRVLCETVLATSPATFELEDLAAAVAEREPGTTATDQDDHDRLAATLHHKHLPVLDAAGLLEYDSADHTGTPDLDAIDALLS